MQGATLTDAHLEGADLSWAHLEEAILFRARLEKVILFGAYLTEADLRGVHLEGAYLAGAHLEKVNLAGAHLEGASLIGAHLEEANLSSAKLDETVLDNIVLSKSERFDGPVLADVNWTGCNLSVVDWSQLKMLGDQVIASRKDNASKRRKSSTQRSQEYRQAVRANRQLSVTLQSQGLNEDAARFAYHAQALQKEVLWFRLIQDNISLRTRISLLGSLFFSWFMFLIAGYGYRFWRTLLTYLAVIRPALRKASRSRKVDKCGAVFAYDVSD